MLSAGGVVVPPGAAPLGALAPPDADPEAGGVASPPFEASDDGVDGSGVVVAGGAGGGETCGVGAGVGFGSSLPHPATAKAASAATIIMRFIVFLGLFSVGNVYRLLNQPILDSNPNAQPMLIRG